VNGIRAISSDVSTVTFEIGHTELGFWMGIGIGTWVSVRERTPGQTVGFCRLKNTLFVVKYQRGRIQRMGITW